MVIAYRVGGLRHSNKTGHDYRTVYYVKTDLAKGTHDARVDRKGKVKTTCWGGLNEDKTPKANDRDDAIDKMKRHLNRKKSEYKHAARAKLMDMAAAKGTRVKFSAKKGKVFAHSNAKIKKSLEKYNPPLHESAIASPPVSAGVSPAVSRASSRAPSRAPSPPPSRPAPRPQNPTHKKKNRPNQRKRKAMKARKAAAA